MPAKASESKDLRGSTTAWQVLAYTDCVETTGGTCGRCHILGMGTRLE